MMLCPYCASMLCAPPPQDVTTTITLSFPPYITRTAKTDAADDDGCEDASEQVFQPGLGRGAREKEGRA